VASPEIGPHLSATQRAALDPRVDPERLEEFLARLPPEVRRFAFNACLREPENDYNLVGSIDPDLAAAWRAVWRPS